MSSPNELSMPPGPLQPGALFPDIGRERTDVSGRGGREETVDVVAVLAPVREPVVGPFRRRGGLRPSRSLISVVGGRRRARGEGPGRCPCRAAVRGAAAPLPFPLPAATPASTAASASAAIPPPPPSDELLLLVVLLLTSNAQQGHEPDADDTRRPRNALVPAPVKSPVYRPARASQAKCARTVRAHRTAGDKQRRRRRDALGLKPPACHPAVSINS